ncbi:MAG: hypothetical protein DI536_30110 [Archangium gephyra]|uniref:Tail specific protease domain-containing protein n=1 Tax=Archangium gephyra TaxID=48 RepID=A0A2W5UTK1_9BACT|nr:MAG: hypothetical protein DI536_30110 [Archangium gephyra]
MLLAAWVAGNAHAETKKPFDRAGWLNDYRTLKAALEANYSHLAWFGSPQGGVDLPALDRRTEQALRGARTDVEATAAFDAFIAAFHDGHLVRRPTSPPPVSPLPEPAKPSSYPDANTACAALGYVPSTRVNFSLPFESLPSFTLMTDGLSEAFRSGVVRSGDRSIGIVRIPRFRAGEFPGICTRAFEGATSRDGGVRPEDISNRVDPVWLDTLAQRLRAFRKEGVSMVLVDLGGNGGGNDLGDWATRAFTSQPLTSAPLQVTAGDAGLPYLQKEVSELSAALAVDGGVNERARAMLEEQRAGFEARVSAAGSPCSMGWVWKERRPWGTSSCTRLVDAGFFSGPLGSLDAGVVDARSASTLFWATIAEPVRGVWSGEVFVLIDGQTASSAEAFTTLLSDHGIARTIGVHTLGAGCGFMNDVAPVVLPNSRLTFSMPNCVRLRKDGSDDVAGVAPDLPVLPLPGESARARAMRVLETMTKRPVNAE